jgi:predicted ArsR family transcriptional regulator
LTARQLGDAYGIEARSARRLLNSLTKAGFATERGKEASRGAGRPQTVFEVHLTSMVAASEK